MPRDRLAALRAVSIFVLFLEELSNVGQIKTVEIIVTRPRQSKVNSVSVQPHTKTYQFLVKGSFR